MTKSSWQDFGTHDESIVPELWDGVVGAWAPCLGPTGSRLHDMSRRSNWGTLTNMDNVTDWMVSDGQYALDFDGTNDYLPLLQSVSRSLPASISLWIQFTTGNLVIISEAQNAVNYSQMYANQGRIHMGLNGIGSAAVIGPIINDGKWHHVVAVWAAENDRRLYVDAALSNTSTFSSTTIFAVNGFCSRSSGSSLFFPGKLDDIKIHSNAPSANAIGEMYQLGRGGMYQRRRRRSIYLPQAGFQAAWAMRRSQIIGGGLR